MNFILNLKDLAGHNELMCPPPVCERMGFLSLHLQDLFHLLLKLCLTKYHCKLFHSKLFMLGGESIKYLT